MEHLDEIWSKNGALGLNGAEMKHWDEMEQTWSTWMKYGTDLEHLDEMQ